MQTQSKKVEDQNKKFESKNNITNTTENTEQNNRKYSAGKNGINNRVQNIGEIIEDKLPVEMANIQTKSKQQDNDIMANKISNYQQQKEATGNGQRKEKVEGPKYSDSEHPGKDGKTYNFRSTTTRAKIEEGERRQYKFRTGSGGELRYQQQRCMSIMQQTC